VTDFMDGASSRPATARARIRPTHMRVSVISPFFNEETILERSVLYTYQNLQRLDGDWEWIIVNDGSTDRSLEIAPARGALDLGVHNP